MDQSELEDRYFNENEIFYDIRRRNQSVLNNAQAPKEAGEENKTLKVKVEEPKEEKVEAIEVKEELTQTDIMKLYRDMKKSNPKLSFQEFCMMVANGDISVSKEANTHGKTTK